LEKFNLQLKLTNNKISTFFLDQLGETKDLLQLWGIENSGLCQLCQNAKGTLHHILSNCLVALNSKRYTWRHDSVLLHLKTALEALVEARNIKNDTAQSFPTINFVKAGAKDTKCTKPVLTPSLLQGASDWKLLVDFDQDQVTFPPEILSTNERPDIVFWSVKARKVILIELTCPAEEGISAAQDRKQTRYLSLISQIQERKWTVKFLTIEVGVRGFVGNSLFKCLISLGFSRSATTKLCKTVSLVSAKCSYAIFLSSGARNLNTGRVLLGPDVI